MKKKLMKMYKTAQKFTKKNSPEILAGLAVVGVIATAVAAYKASPKAHAILEEKKRDMEDVAPDDKETKRAVVAEAAKELTPVLLPPVIMGGMTAACIIGSNRISSKRIAILSAAYSLAEKSVKELEDKMTDIIGEKKTREIKDKIVEDKFKKDKVNGDAAKTIVMTGDGDVPCIDLYTGRPFKSNYQKIGQAINELSSDVQGEMYVTLNDFYDKIKTLERIPMGDDFGWNTDDLIHGTLPIDMCSQLTEDGIPVLCIDYRPRPVDVVKHLY